MRYVFRQLQKQRLKHTAGVVVRDSLRNEVAKQQRIDEEMNAKRAQQRMDIEKLNLLINQAEEQMVSLQKSLEQVESVEGHEPTCSGDVSNDGVAVSVSPSAILEDSLTLRDLLEIL